ncbi:MAG: ribonuclease Z [Firmicutes bacterium]|nr:ribonuclease Z [Bacillota bacterium]MDD4692867.1 ribonuclease Z [Bacillota bacterium]
MKITFLGTGAGKPSKERNVSSLLLNMVEELGYAFLFDCGEGAQLRLMHLPVKLNQINHIFITHLHGDHLFGLPGLLGSRSFENKAVPLDIYGPKGLALFIDTILKVSQTHLSYPFEVTEISSGDAFYFDRFKIETALLDHGLPSFGYRVTETKPGALDAEKLKELGVPPGPIYGRLKNGETVVLDGNTYRGSDFIKDQKTDRVITICGDTRKCDSAIKLAKDSSVLVFEATYMDIHQEKADKYYHSTSKDAASIASESGTRSLILNHTSSRYLDQGKALLEEAKEVFGNTYLASDFTEFDVTPDGAKVLSFS